MTVRDTDWGIFDISQLFSKLNSVDSDLEKIKIILKGEMVHVYGMAVIAAWLSSRSVKLEVSGEPRVRGYLESIGLLDLNSVKETGGIQYDSKKHLGLTFVSSDSRFSTETTVGRFLELFEPHLLESKENRGALATTFAELVENVQLHSHCTDGYMVAQVHPMSKKLHLAVADTGIGIRKSFLRGDNKDARKRIQSDEEALLEACRPLVTSKKAGHAGYGLHVVSELAQRNQGTFLLASGDSLLRKWAKRKWTGSLKREREVKLHSGWEGTLVGAMFDLSKPIPIDLVYDELPLPKGYSKEDFFE